MCLLVLPDPCSRLTCEHICLNTKSGPECLCFEGYNIAKDGKSCTGNHIYTYTTYTTYTYTILILYASQQMADDEKKMYIYSNVMCFSYMSNQLASHF